MTKIYIEGELYLTLETVAEVYAVQVVWLREVCESGLLEAMPTEESTLCIAAMQLDRVAKIVRMNLVLGLDFTTIEVLLHEGS